MAMIGGLLGAMGAGFNNLFVPSPRHSFIYGTKPSRNNRMATHWSRQQAKDEFRDKVLGKAFRQYRKRYAGY